MPVCMSFKISVIYHYYHCTHTSVKLTCQKLNCFRISNMFITIQWRTQNTSVILLMRSLTSPAAQEVCS